MASKINVISFKAGLSNDIEIISLGDTVANHRYQITFPHRDDFYTIFWYQKGNATHTVDFKPVNVTPGSVLFVGKSRVQILDPTGNYDGKILLFTDRFFEQLPDNGNYLRNNILFNDLLEQPLLNLKVDSPVLSVFREIEKELAQAIDAVQYQILHNLLHNLLLLAERERRQHGFVEIRKGAELDLTMAFTKIIEDKFRALKSVSAFAGLDEPTNFVKYFRKHETKTPSEFRRRIS